MKTKVIHTQSLAVDNTPDGRAWVGEWVKAWTKLGYSVIEESETTGSIYTKLWTMIEIGGEDDAAKDCKG